MAYIVIASDSEAVREEVKSVLDPDEDEVEEVAVGARVVPVVREDPPDLVVTDFQIGSMGAVAICLDLRLEESGGRIPHVPVLMLLDRRADVFLWRRSGAEGYVVKPLDAFRLRRAIRAVLAGQRFEDPTYRPEPVLVPPETATTSPLRLTRPEATPPTSSPPALTGTDG